MHEKQRVLKGFGFL